MLFIRTTLKFVRNDNNNWNGIAATFSQLNNLSNCVAGTDPVIHPGIHSLSVVEKCKWDSRYCNNNNNTNNTVKTMGFHENHITIEKKYAVSQIKDYGGNSSSCCAWSLFVTSYDLLKNNENNLRSNPMSTRMYNSVRNMFQPAQLQLNENPKKIWKLVRSFERPEVCVGVSEHVCVPADRLTLILLNFDVIHLHTTWCYIAGCCHFFFFIYKISFLWKKRSVLKMSLALIKIK